MPLFRTLCFVLPCAFAFVACRSAAAPAGFTPLFNGRDLSGWRGGDVFDPRALAELDEPQRAAKIAGWSAAMHAIDSKTGRPHWHVANGELVSDGLGGCATTEQEHENFELLLEFQSAPKSEAAIYLRGVPQVTLASRASAPGREGAGGKWQRARVRMVGSRVSAWVDDRVVLDHAYFENRYDRGLSTAQPRPVPRRGPLQLQNSGGTVRWRGIFVRAIGNDEARQVLAGEGKKEFQRIFNGRDLTGWAGDLASIEVKDGALIWVKGTKGTVYWNETLADFQARVLFKVPPGGNNGLAIRYPGQGVAAYDAMTEIQILDENYEKVRGPIDPRQVHGSAAQMVGAIRGYQFPTGEWNFQEVTVQGSRVKVELNGSVILDTDIAKVDLKKILGKRPQTGAQRREGFFGFAGHDDPVAFKDVFIRRLPLGGDGR